MEYWEYFKHRFDSCAQLSGSLSDQEHGPPTEFPWSRVAHSRPIELWGVDNLMKSIVSEHVDNMGSDKIRRRQVCPMLNCILFWHGGTMDLVKSDEMDEDGEQFPVVTRQHGE